MNPTNITSAAPTADTPTGSSFQEASPLVVESAGQDFEFYYRWSLEERQRTMTLLAEATRHMTNLSAALLAGSLTFLTGHVARWSQGATALLLLASLCAGLLGSLPMQATWPVNEPMVFRRAQEQTSLHKTRLLWASGTLIGLSFVVAVAGLLLRSS
jgi:hypothetical protein